MKKPVLLCILDGFGNAPHSQYNAITNANTPNLNRIKATYPHSEIATSGLAVGLPEGQMGNSEVGHMTIGSGRIIYQTLPRIHLAIENNEL
jgi:2,3-bisphosphoglycerate-independent phosphoglycerate mutase